MGARNITLPLLSGGIAIVLFAAGTAGLFTSRNDAPAPQSPPSQLRPQPLPTDQDAASFRGLCAGDPCQVAVTGDGTGADEVDLAEPEPGVSVAGMENPGIPSVDDPVSREPHGVELIGEEGDKVGLLGQALRTLPKGKILLVAPEAMTSEEEREVTAIVGREISNTALRKYIGPSDQAETGTLHVSSRMMATLTGPNFAVTPMTPDVQTIADGFYTEWRWQVKARKAGDHPLTAILYAVVGESQHSIDSYKTVVKVKVEPSTWVDLIVGTSEGAANVAESGAKMAAFLTALATLLAGITGWWYRQKARRPTRAGSAPSGGGGRANVVLRAPRKRKSSAGGPR